MENLGNLVLEDMRQPLEHEDPETVLRPRPARLSCGPRSAAPAANADVWSVKKVNRLAAPGSAVERAALLSSSVVRFASNLIAVRAFEEASGRGERTALLSSSVVRFASNLIAVGAFEEASGRASPFITQYH
jgi:hypothetical protein